MADFSELVAQLRAPGEDGLPETIYDDLSSSYSLAVDGGVAKAAELSAVNTELAGEIARLKALNFDLLMAASSENEPDPEPDPEPSSDDESIDSLFDKE